MPYRDPEKRRSYHREYMRTRPPSWDPGRSWNAAYYRKNKERIYAKTREWALKNPAMVAIYKFRSVQKLRRETIERYGGRCVCCGETNPVFLTLDHVNGGGTADRTQRRAGGWPLYAQLRQEGWPAGFQVLCFNCNYAKYRMGACPHRILGRNGTLEVI